MIVVAVLIGVISLVAGVLAVLRVRYLRREGRRMAGEMGGKKGERKGKEMEGWFGRGRRTRGKGMRKGSGKWVGGKGGKSENDGRWRTGSLESRWSC